MVLQDLLENLHVMVILVIAAVTILFISHGVAVQRCATCSINPQDVLLFNPPMFLYIIGVKYT
jgi:hypothetical protein